ncbi:MAG: DNA-binding protein [Gammaproteobacteria bacterium]
MQKPRHSRCRHLPHGRFFLYGGWGPWVKAWRETQTASLASAILLPENVTQAMHKMVSDLWTTASALATERVTNAKQDLKEARERFNTELAEYATEVKRL